MNSFIAFMTNASDVKRILEHIGELSESPPISPSRVPPGEEFEFDQDVEYEFNQDVKGDDGFEFDQRVEDDDDPVM